MSEQREKVQIVVNCAVCEKDFRFGQNVYKGRRIKAWDIMVCDICEQSNHDGLVPAKHLNLIAKLQEKGIGTKPNAKGWIDIPD